jgi:predicted transcriptional regulator
MPSRILQQSHREQYEIIQQLLQTANSKVKGCKQFELAYESQLNWPRFTYYRDFLISCEFLIPTDEEPVQSYEITPKGKRYLQLFAEMEDVLRAADTRNKVIGSTQ